MTKKKLFFWGYMIAAFVFLFNPNANLIDVLPDAVGYLFLMLAIRNAQDVFPRFDEAYRGFSKVFWVALAKIPALFIMLRIVNLNNYERSIITVFAFGFTVLELIFALPAFRSFFAALAHLGEKEGLMPVLAAGKSAKGLSGLERLTYIFLIAKGALSFLPELALLSVFDPLEAGEASPFNPARFYPLFLLIALFAGAVLGIIWLYYAIGYVKDLKKSAVLKEFLEDKAETLSPSLKTASLKRVRLCALYLILAALILAFDPVLDGKNFLPDVFSGLALMLCMLLLLRESRFSRVGAITALAYALLSVLHNAVEAGFLAEYTVIDVHRKSEAASAYFGVILTSALEGLALIALCVLLFYVLRDLSATLLTETARERGREGYDEKVFTSLLKPMRLMLILGAVSAAWPTVETYLLTLSERHVVTAEEANQYYSEGQVLYYSVFGGSWMAGFCLTAAWVIAGFYFIHILREETKGLED